MPGGTPLRIVARAAGTSVERLRQLNPELLYRGRARSRRALPFHVPPRGVARANTMLSRLLAHWHPGRRRPGRRRLRLGHGGTPADALAARAEARRSGTIPWRRHDLPHLARPRQPPASDRDAGEEAAADGETAVVFYRVDEGETLPASRVVSAYASRVVADNRLDPAAKLQKGMLLKLHVPRAALSRLASERPLDDSQYAPPVQLDGGASPDDESTIAAPAPTPAPSPEVRVPSRGASTPWRPPAPLPAAPTSSILHGGRSGGRRSMADFPELFARETLRLFESRSRCSSLNHAPY